MPYGSVPGDWTEQYAGSQLNLSDFSLSFSDEFDTMDVGPDGGTGKWFAPVHAPFGAAQFVAPDASTNPFSVANGQLTISMSQVDGHWQSGTMQTVDSADQGFAQEYGYFEMRAAFHGGAGAWPAFWMLPQDTSIPRPEIDIVEAYGGDPDGHHQSVHVRVDGTDNWDSNFSGLPSSMFDGTFHTYGAMITTDWIIVYFDGVELSRFPMNDFFRTPLYMLVTLAMNPSEVAQASGTYDMVVDYVHAYAAPAVMEQHLTGRDAADTLTGGNFDDVLDGGAGADTMSGGLGNDTYYVDQASDTVVETDGGGIDTVQSAISFDLVDSTTVHGAVENLTLLGSDNLNGTGNALDNVLTGNAGDNVLDGGAGSDVLDGGAGADVMAGDAGDDTYVVDNAGDVVDESTGDGIDLIKASVSYSLADALGAVENLRLLGSDNINGTGNALDNVLTGNAGANVLDAGAGADILSGGAGADVMIGGVGDDIYVVDNAGDVVDESTGDGADLIQASVSYSLANTLGAVENLTLLGPDNLKGTGNSLDNVLTGNTGPNVLDGGAGADVMAGDLGDDTYVVDNAGDVVDESTGAGVDLIQASVSYNLASALGAVENLTLLGSDNLNGTGNTLDNVLTGNAGANVLNGGAGSDVLDGGAGADVMAGGVGDDIYVVDSAGDVVDESTAAGVDLIQASISYSLANALGTVEKLTLLGSDNLNGTGNALNNVLTGNAGGNVLNGGAGADVMAGGIGDDTYVVDNAGDVVDESTGAGVDLIQASVSYSLASVHGAVENLTLLGPANLNGTGNALNNVLTGNAGANVLDGGAGADVMAGGTGNDTYVVDNAGDVVDESSGGGVDLAKSSITFSLSDALHVLGDVENLILTGTASVNGTGNALANVIIGNTGNNALAGLAGADTLDGGAGADTASYAASAAGVNVSLMTRLAQGGDAEGDTFSSIESLTGSAQNDTLEGDGGNNVLNGGAGIDALSYEHATAAITMSLATSSVQATGGSGSDTISGFENLVGSAFGDTLTGGSTANVISGLDGNDTINGGGGADTMIGGTGNDAYVVDNAGDVVDESSGGGVDLAKSSITFSLSDALHVLGDVENLILTGTASVNGTGNALANVIIGNTGNNALAGLAGADTLDGGAGADTASYAASAAGVNVSLMTRLAQGGDAEGDTFSSIESLTGSAQNDTLEGDGGNNVLNGGAGIDALSYEHATAAITMSLATSSVQATGGSGSDTISGFENLVGSAFGDTLTGGSTANVISGLDGNDTINGGGGADTMIGGTGNDAYVVDNAGDVVDESSGGGVDLAKSSITFSLSDALHVLGDVENLILTGTASVNGTGNALANVIIGNTGNNALAGLAGADTLDGGAGADTASYAASAAGVNVSLMTRLAQGGDAEGDTFSSIESLTGSAQNDTLEGDGGNNVLNGGAGIDALSYEHATAAITMSLATSSVQATGGSGSDTISGFENLVGSAFGDTLTGGSTANVISGLDGNDTINGGGGADTMIGGTGNDRFVFATASDSNPASADTIADFLHGADVIDLSPIDTNTSTAGDQAFAYGGQNGSVLARTITWFESAGNTIVQADVNGNTTADLRIVLTGVNLGLTALDFLL